MTPAEKRRLTMLENKVNSLQVQIDWLKGLWIGSSKDQKTGETIPHYLYKPVRRKYSKRKTYVDWSGIDE